MKICTKCGTTTKGKTITKGSFFIELILWLCFFVPGIIYSMWRLSTRYEACPECGAVDLVPVNSPAGKKLSEQYA